MRSLIISDYKNISDFKSTYFGFPVGEDKTSYVALQLLYDQAFKNFDHQTKMQEGFNEIFEDYNQQGKDIEYTSCNQLWFMASFDPGVVAVSFKENKAIINYKTGMSDTVECGEKAWEELNDCVKNYNLLHGKYP